MLLFRFEMEGKHVLLPFPWDSLTLNEFSSVKLSTAIFISLLTLVSSCFFQINVCDLGISFHYRHLWFIGFHSSRNSIPWRKGLLTILYIVWPWRGPLYYTVFKRKKSSLMENQSILLVGDWRQRVEGGENLLNCNFCENKEKGSSNFLIYMCMSWFSSGWLHSSKNKSF